MKEKIKLVFDNGSLNATENITINGQTIEVKKRISCEDKDAFAIDYASRMCIIDEAKEIAYKNIDAEIILVFLMFKYYTNVDVSEYEDDIGKFYDHAGEYRYTIFDICMDDMCLTEKMSNNCANRMIDNYNKEHSFGHKLMMSLNGVITGEDIMKRLAESKIINEEMIDILDRAGKPANNVEWANFAKKAE